MLGLMKMVQMPSIPITGTALRMGQLLKLGLIVNGYLPGRLIVGRRQHLRFVDCRILKSPRQGSEAIVTRSHLRDLKC